MRGSDRQEVQVATAAVTRSEVTGSEVASVELGCGDAVVEAMVGGEGVSVVGRAFGPVTEILNSLQGLRLENMGLDVMGVEEGMGKPPKTGVTSYAQKHSVDDALLFLPDALPDKIISTAEVESTLNEVTSCYPTQARQPTEDGVQHTAVDDSELELALGAEELIPLMAYALVQAQLPSLVSEVRFIEEYLCCSDQAQLPAATVENSALQLVVTFNSS